MGGLAQNVQKPPLGKNVQKSQGQIFQECVECQGQMPRSNAKVKNFRNVWNVWNVWNVKTKNGKIQNENKMGKRKKRNIKFSKIIFHKFLRIL